MLKYEKKLKLDEHYKKFQSGLFPKAIALTWSILGYALLYYLVKYIVVRLPDLSPWNNWKEMFSFGKVQFLKIDVAYFVWGLVNVCYGSLKLAQITAENQSVRGKEDDKPSKLLVTGSYGKVRHPMYGAFATMQVGFMLSLRSLIGLVAALILLAVQFISAGFEEKKQLVPLFGEEYVQYRKKVSRLLLTGAESIVVILAFLLSVAGFIF